MTVAGKLQQQRPWGAKTGIEQDAIEKAYFASKAPTQQGTQQDMDQAQQEARDTIRRETRGKAPDAYAAGGKVKGWGKARGARAAKVK